MAVSFSVLKAFGVQNLLQPALLKFLAPLGQEAAEVSNNIVEFVNHTQVGVLGASGLALLFYTVISLLQKIEEAFNTIWQVPGTRRLARRFSDYLSVILVGPVLLFAAAGITASLKNYTVARWLLSVEPLGTWLLALSQWVPLVLICLAFALLYKFMINTSVRPTAALAGGVFAGMLWMVIGKLFASFVVSSSSYSAIYSGFAGAVLFILWLNVSWQVTLVGAQVAFYWQNPHFLEPRNQTVAIGNRRREALALAIMILIGRAHYYNRPRWTLEALETFHQDVQSDTLASLVQALEEQGLLVRSAHEPPAYLPARAIETITLEEVVAAARGGGEVQSNLSAVDAIIERIDEAIAQILGKRTLKDVVLEGETEEGPVQMINASQSREHGQRSH
jgi:membrane protein